jgi:GNAT superfamily N-acetyltransferase
MEVGTPCAYGTAEFCGRDVFAATRRAHLSLYPKDIPRSWKNAPGRAFPTKSNIDWIPFPQGDMPVDFEIAQLQTYQLDELPEFLRSVYPGKVRKTDLAYLRWFYEQNPNVDSDALPIWALRRNGLIIGQLGTIPVELKVGAIYTKAIWILEFVIVPEFRGKGLGKKLVMAAGEKYRTMITLGINDASTRVFSSLGWKPMGRIRRYHKFLFVGSSAGIPGRRSLLREGLNRISFPLRASLEPKNPKYTITCDRVFGPELGQLWEQASAQWCVAVRRDQKFLEWQFLHQPRKLFDCICLHKEDRLVGYAVLFFRAGRDGGPPPKAAISDLIYHSKNQDEVIDALLNAALQLAIERKAGSLVTDVLDARAEARLKKLGFSRIKNSPPFMAISSEFPNQVHDPANWYLTRADADISIFEEPNVA